MDDSNDSASRYDSMLIESDSGIMTLSELQPGTIFGRYRIESLAGRGGQAVVYRARDTSLKRTVAVKVLHPYGLISDTLRARFAREGQLAARLDHECICPVLESGVVNGLLYIAMPWLEGVTLSAYRQEIRMKEMEEGRRLGIALRIGVNLASALCSAHASGVLHRDMKPTNIMIDSLGKPMILDFGIAGETRGELTELTQEGDAFGTTGYMAPEQCGIVPRWGKIDGRADQFSLAVVLWELITGERPFFGDSRAEYEQALRAGRLNALGHTDQAASVKIVLARALRFDPRERLGDIRILAEDLERCIAGTAILTRRLSWLARAVSWGRREPALAGMVIALIVSLSVGLVVSLFSMGEARESTRVARWETYRSSLSAANARVRLHDLAGALVELNRCPEDLRGWEWRRLRLEVDPSAHRSTFGSPPTWTRELLSARDVRQLPDKSTAVLVGSDLEEGTWRVYQTQFEGVIERGREVTCKSSVVSLSADGRSIWFSPDPNRVRCRSIDSDRELGFDGNFGQVNKLVASACGRFLAICSSEGGAYELVVCLLPTGRILTRVGLGSRSVAAMSFDESGERLFVASADPGRASKSHLSWVSPWSGELLAERTVAFDASGPVICDPRDGGVILAARDGTVRWLDLGLTHEYPATFAHASGCLCLWFTGSNEVMALGKTGELCSWEGLPPHASWQATIGSSNQVMLAFGGRQSSLMIANAQNEVRVLSSEGLSPDLNFPGEGVEVGLMTDGGAILATLVATFQWTTASGAWSPLHTMGDWLVGGLGQDGRAAYVGRPLGAPSQLASGRDVYRGEVGFLRGSREGEGPVMIQAVPDINALSLGSMHGSRMVIQVAEGLRCFDFESQSTSTVRVDASASISSLAMDRDAERVAMGMSDGRILVATFGGEVIAEWPVSAQPVGRLSFLPDGDRIVALVGSQVSISSLRAESVLMQLGRLGSVASALAVDSVDSHIAVGCSDGTVHIWSDSRDRFVRLPALPSTGQTRTVEVSVSAGRLAGISDTPGLPRSVYRWALQRVAILETEGNDEESLRVSRELLRLRCGDVGTAIVGLNELAFGSAGANGLTNYRASLSLVLAHAKSGDSDRARSTLDGILTWRKQKILEGKGQLLQEAVAAVEGGLVDLSFNPERLRVLLPVCENENLDEAVRKNFLSRLAGESDEAAAILSAALWLRLKKPNKAIDCLTAVRGNRSVSHLGAIYCAYLARALAGGGNAERASAYAQRVRLIAGSADGDNQASARTLVEMLMASGL